MREITESARPGVDGIGPRASTVKIPMSWQHLPQIAHVMVDQGDGGY